MKKLKYVDFQMQEYLELKDMNASQAKALYKFRVRMAPFGENYKVCAQSVTCPLCQSHPDGQEESFSP